MRDHETDEVVVITDGSGIADAGLDASARVVFRVSSRVTVVRAPWAAVPALRRLEGVVAVLDEYATTDVPTHLDENERMFFQAWQRRGEPAGRRHEGRDWDAAGLEPPDGPPEESEDDADHHGSSPDSTPGKDRADGTDEP